MAHSIANFTIDYHQYLGVDGKPTQPLPTRFTQNKQSLITLYSLMQELRVFDAKAVALQRTGKMGTFPSSLGQEAIAIGIGHTLNKDDVFCPYYREHGALFQRGVKMSDVLSYWGGDERGSDFNVNREDFPTCVPIASQCLHAVGIAYAIKLRRQKRAVLVACGDGATSKGDFYEALNFAGIYALPVVFVVNNNQWAISVSRDKQTAAQTIAQKAIAGGFEGLQADGNDIIAVCETLNNALHKARDGGGPTLIEMLSYRLCDHTTADDAKRYVDPKAREEAAKKEPLARLRHYLMAEGDWSDAQEKALLTTCKEKVDAAAKDYLERSPQPPTALFDFLYHTLPEALKTQRNELNERE